MVISFTVLSLSVLLFLLAFCQVYVLTSAPELERLRQGVVYLASVLLAQVWLFIRRAIKSVKKGRS